MSFYNGCEDGKVGCNGRGKQGKDALACVPKGFARTQSQLSTHRCSPNEKWVGLLKCETVQLYIEPRPTKSGWDSTVLGGLVQGELWQGECFEVLGIEVLSNSIPTIVGSA